MAHISTEGRVAGFLWAYFCKAWYYSKITTIAALGEKRRSKTLATRTKNYACYFFFQFRKKEKGESSSTYLFCPGGAAPDGFWFSLSCVNASFWQDGCCPPGCWPAGFVQEVSTELILAATGAATDETSMATDSAAAMAASATNVTLCVFIIFDIFPRLLSAHNVNMRCETIRPRLHLELGT